MLLARLDKYCSVLGNEYPCQPRQSQSLARLQNKPLETVEQVWRQMEAENVEEFKAAVSMQQMPMFTYVCESRPGPFMQETQNHPT